jgi:alanine-glyoxylate transaminase/serine-glyoxylate transaminase/serine-pyruvate transaminase
MAESLGVEVEYIPTDWRSAIDVDQVEARLREDKEHSFKAVLAVHTDTATSTTSDIAAVRRAIDAAGHPALLMVDTIAALATVDFQMDEWGVDVAVAAGQKGLMQPPGLAFTAASEKALRVNETSTMPRNYWDWRQRQAKEYYRAFCGTSPEHLLFAMREALDMILEEGLDAVFARHQRLAEAVRSAIAIWSRGNALSFNATNPAERSNGVTTIRVAEPYNGDDVRITCREHYDLSLGAGLGELSGQAFRIGHMGYLNEPMVLGALASVEAALAVCKVPFERGGVDAAIDFLNADKADAPFAGVWDESRRTA